jgi:hypothetical protein
MSALTLTKAPAEAEPGFTIGTFSKAAQDEFMKKYRERYPQTRPTADGMRPDHEEKFATPPGYDAHREHHRVFYDAIRAGKRPVEDAVFGFRAAGPALLSNVSYFERRICGWDAEKMEAV